MKNVRLIAMSFLVFFSQGVFAANASVLDSGKSAQEIAAEILRGARERYAKEQDERSKVVMYSTSWCGYCRKARKYFKANDIKFVEHDIERNLAAKQDYDRLGGNGVPLIVVGENKMNGFSRKRFDRLYQFVN